MEHQNSIEGLMLDANTEDSPLDAVVRSKMLLAEAEGLGETRPFNILNGIVEIQYTPEELRILNELVSENGKRFPLRQMGCPIPSAAQV